MVDAGELCFEEPVIEEAWVDPTAVVAADFDEDGHLDLAIADRGTDAVWMLFGDGDGNLTPPVPHMTLDAPRVMFTGDFDGNDDVDVITLGEFTGGYDILLGDGAGDLTAVGAAMYEVIGVAPGDLDGDGNDDIVLGTPDGYAVQLSNGDGTFQLPIGYEVNGHDGDATHVVDLDGDDALDAVVLLDEEGDDPAGTLRTTFGDGNGALAQQQEFDVLDDGDALLSADFDGDDLVDIAMLRGSQECFIQKDPPLSESGCASALHPTMGEVNVLLNEGAGVFAQPASYVHGTNPTAFATADIDADQDADILIAYDTFRFATLLRGDGDGDFETLDPFDVGFRITDIELADLNEDGVPDIALTRAGIDDSLTGELIVYLSDP